MSVFGTRLFGKIRQLDGVGYIATQFFHVNFVPLVPLGSYVVLDGGGNEDGSTGFKVPMQTLSVIAGYVRGWAGAVACLAGTVGLGSAVSLANGPVSGPPYPVWPMLVALAASVALFGAFARAKTPWWLLAWSGFLAASLLFFIWRLQHPQFAGHHDDQNAVAGLIGANIAYLLYALTRALDLPTDDAIGIFERATGKQLRHRVPERPPEHARYDTGQLHR